ncbi:hypothetical protein HYW21_06455 [Candidatus Woesearchaeota archaeon]|nr:hypothetical protein [Candidatus Woesearchaeota archaeon]
MNLDELKKLSPQERVNALKKFEEERKKELVEAEKLMKESLTEIRMAEVGRTVEVPQVEPVDISKLFESTTEGLEKKVPPSEIPQRIEQQIRYEVKQNYEALKELTQEMSRAGTFYSMPESNQQRVREIEDRLSQFNIQNYSLDIARQIVASMGIIEKIKRYGGMPDQLQRSF